MIRQSPLDWFRNIVVGGVISVILLFVGLIANWLFGRVGALPGVGSLMVSGLLELFLLLILVFVGFSATITAAGIRSDRPHREFRFVLPLTSWARFLIPASEAVVLASWMGLLVTFPVLVGFAAQFGSADIGFAITSFLGVAALALTASLFGVMVLFGTQYFLARYPKITLLSGLGLAGLTLGMLGRQLPERLVLNPEEAPLEVLDLVVGLTCFSQAGIPSHELSRLLNQSVRDLPLDAYAILTMGLTLGGLFVLVLLLGPWLQNQLQRNTGETQQKRHPIANWFRPRLSWLPPPMRALITIDWLRFGRDRAQWFQGFLLGFLFLVFLGYLGKTPGQTLFERFLYQGFSLLVISFFTIAACTRFLLPLPGLDAEVRWLPRTSPTPKDRIFWVRVCLVGLPILILALGLSFATGWYQPLSLTGLGVNLLVAANLVIPVILLAKLLGAYFPQYDAENIGVMVTSPVGLLYIATALAWVVLVVSILMYPLATGLGQLLHQDRIPPGFALSLVGTTVTTVILAYLEIKLTNLGLNS